MNEDRVAINNAVYTIQQTVGAALDALPAGLTNTARKARRVSGGVSALTALGVYLLSVALLPDTQFFELLLAVTFAVLFVAFRALVRSQLELRLRGPTPPSP